MILKNVRDPRRPNRLIVYVVFRARDFLERRLICFFQLAILNFLKENQEIEEEDLVWVVDLI